MYNRRNSLYKLYTGTVQLCYNAKKFFPKKPSFLILKNRNLACQICLKSISNMGFVTRDLSHMQASMFLLRSSYAQAPFNCVITLKICQETCSIC